MLTVTRTEETCYAEKSPILARFAIASLLSTALSHQLLESHKHSGVAQTEQGFAQLLNAFIVTNAVAASVQLCGAMLLTGVLLAGNTNGVNLRQIVLLVCSISSCIAISNVGRPAPPPSCCAVSLFAQLASNAGSPNQEPLSRLGPLNAIPEATSWVWVVLQMS